MQQICIKYLLYARPQDRCLSFWSWAAYCMEIRKYICKQKMLFRDLSIVWRSGLSTVGMGLWMPIFSEMCEGTQFLPSSTFIIAFSILEGSNNLFPLYLHCIFSLTVALPPLEEKIPSRLDILSTSKTCLLCAYRMYVFDPGEETKGDHHLK